MTQSSTEVPQCDSVSSEVQAFPGGGIAEHALQRNKASRYRTIPVSAITPTHFQGVRMQRTLGLALVMIAFSLSAWPQAKPATTTPPHRAAAKPAPADANAPDPIAIIDTTAGKMTC